LAQRKSYLLSTLAMLKKNSVHRGPPTLTVKGLCFKQFKQSVVLFPCRISSAQIKEKAHGQRRARAASRARAQAMPAQARRQRLNFASLLRVSCSIGIKTLLNICNSNNSNSGRRGASVSLLAERRWSAVQFKRRERQQWSFL
jgi:hypothetical protein